MANSLKPDTKTYQDYQNQHFIKLHLNPQSNNAYIGQKEASQHYIQNNHILQKIFSVKVKQKNDEEISNKETQVDDAINIQRENENQIDIEDDQQELEFIEQETEFQQMNFDEQNKAFRQAIQDIKEIENQQEYNEILQQLKQNNLISNPFFQQSDNDRIKQVKDVEEIKNWQQTLENVQSTATFEEL